MFVSKFAKEIKDFVSRLEFKIHLAVSNQRSEAETYVVFLKLKFSDDNAPAKVLIRSPFATN